MTDPAQDHSATRRKPWLAALLSLPCPGLGHLYAGDLWGMFFSLLLVYFAFTVPITSALSHLARSTIWLVWLGPILIITLVPLYAWISARRAAKPYQLKAYNRWHIYLAVWLGWMLLYGIAQEARKEVIEAYRIPSASMEPSVLVGDFLYVDKRPATIRAIRHGTIIVFESVEEPGMQVLKRVVGMPGDTMAMVQGRLVRNGQPISEPEVNPPQDRSEDAVQREKMLLWQRAFLVGRDTGGYAPDLSDWGPLQVPPESYLVLGDNRDHAYDSRYWGFVPAQNITGLPRVVYWSFDRESYIPLPFLFAVRWERVGRVFSQ